MTTKTHRRKIYAAMECESVEISAFLQVRFELWSFKKISAPELDPDIQDIIVV